MSEILRALYNRFYKKLELTKLSESVETNHRLLIELLDKPERKLVLRVIDNENAIANALSRDGFLCGFALAWKLTNRLNHLENERSALTDEVEWST